MFKYLITVCLVASVVQAYQYPEESHIGLVSNGAAGVVSQNVPIVLQSVPAAEVAPVGVEHVHHPQVGPSYYSHGGLQIYANDHIIGNKPVHVRNLEQFGQPEVASLPANYKPWGSWGLYIGGNPADGYYSNYYKALGSSVDKQVSAGEVRPSGDQTVAFGPVVRQASSLPYLGADYYPFAYSQGELNSASRVPVEAVPVNHAQIVPVAPVAPVQAAPAAFEPSFGVSSYADSYATKKLGSSSTSTKGSTKSTPSAPAPPSPAQAKGYQTRSFLYPVVSQLSAPLPQQQQTVASVVNQQQVVAYPVPVGSQIVGSQVGVEGAFAPYGVHAFTRYAVKPALVEPSTYYYNSPSPFYGNQFYSPYYSPFTYYSSYASPAHYSVESAPVQEPQYSPVTTTVEVVSEKAETDDKLYTKGQVKI